MASSWQGFHPFRVLGRWCVAYVGSITWDLSIIWAIPLAPTQCARSLAHERTQVPSFFFFLSPSQMLLIILVPDYLRDWNFTHTWRGNDRFDQREPFNHHLMNFHSYVGHEVGEFRLGKSHQSQTKYISMVNLLKIKGYGVVVAESLTMLFLLLLFNHHWLVQSN